MKVFIFCLFLVLQTGCATILQPGPDHVPVTSIPDGAKVFLDGKEVGTTPMEVSIERDAEGVIRIEKEGYNPYTKDLDKKLAGWSLLGSFPWAVPFLIDVMNHNQGKYSTKPLDFHLSEKEKPVENKISAK